MKHITLDGGSKTEYWFYPDNVKDVYVVPCNDGIHWNVIVEYHHGNGARGTRRNKQQAEAEKARILKLLPLPLLSHQEV